MTISYNPDIKTILDEAYVADSISVGTTQIEAKAGVSALEDRETVRIYNNTGTVIYFGPTGVTPSTGEPIRRRQWVEISAGSNIQIFLITDSGTASDVRIQEFK